MDPLIGLLNEWGGRLPRAALTVLLIVLLLAVEWFLPARTAGYATYILVLFAGVPLFFLLGVRVWPVLILLAVYAPLAPYLRKSGLSNLESLAKDIIALGVFVLWLVGALLSRRRLVRTHLDMPLLLLVLLGVLNVLRAPGLLRGVLAFKIFFMYIPIYFLVVQNPPSRKQLRILFWAIMLVGLVTALYGIYQYTLGGNIISYVLPSEAGDSTVALSNWRGGHLRAFSTLGHANLFGLWLAMCLAFGFGLECSTSGLARIILFAAILVLVTAVPMTLSRMGWIATVLAISTTVLFSTRSKWPARLALAVAAIVFAFVLSGPIVNETLAFTGSKTDESFRDRPGLIYWAARMTFVEMPEGCGLGVLADAAGLASRITGAYEPPYTCIWRGYPVQGGDTVAFSLGVQMGALGFLLYFLLFALMWKHGVNTYCNLSDPFLKGVAASILGYLAMMTASNFFSGSPSGYPVVDLYFWLFVGILMSLERVERGMTNV